MCMCVVSGFFGVDFLCVFFRGLRILCVCDVLGSSSSCLWFITRICMYVNFFGGEGQIACDFQKLKNLCVYEVFGVKLFVFFRRLRIVCVCCIVILWVKLFVFFRSLRTYVYVCGFFLLSNCFCFLRSLVILCVWGRGEREGSCFCCLFWFWVVVFVLQQFCN
jgi:hypothetical protein